MNLPLDIPALLKAATDIDEARNTPLAVSVYLDETARAQRLCERGGQDPGDHRVSG